MRRLLFAALALLLAGTSRVSAHGLLIPAEKTLPPLAMVDHKVTVKVDEQLTVTRVEQTFRNHTDRQLEATYIFPVPAGASVNKFTMWVDGKETKGEMLEAARAREIYTSIVRRVQDPGLLEYMDHNLFRLRVFPIPPRGDQKVALSYTAVAPKEGKLVEYIYPLKTDGKAVETLEKFSVEATVRSDAGVNNVYSPSHSLNLKRVSDKEVKVSFEKDKGQLDRDFQMFYTLGKDDIGMGFLTHRPIAAEKGYFTLLVTPRFGLEEKYRVPRDVVMVLDTSGSMRGPKMEQARKALKYCLGQLSGGSGDRFGLINFATAVNRYEEKLVDASSDQLDKARKWIDDLEATGGTAINDALASALELRSKDEARPFTVIFFTDGCPTIGETDPDRIFKNVKDKNTANTRIFTFGVGDDVNAALLDRLAEQTRAVSAYVRPAEDIEVKVSSLYGKMSNPVLTDLKLATTTEGVKLSEVYPVALPDLFHNGQLVVFGRFTGHGSTAVKLTGKVGKDEKEFAYDVTIPEKTDDSREFVEQLWARRKVGFLLDEIRVNGEKKELKDEVVALARKYGITTPYTSYLIVPDTVTPPVVAMRGGPGAGGGGFGAAFDRPIPRALAPRTPVPGAAPATEPAKPLTVEEFARAKDDNAARRGEIADRDLAGPAPADPKSPGSVTATSGLAAADGKKLAEAREKKATLDKAREALDRKDKEGVHTGKLGVDLALENADLRNTTYMHRSAIRNVNGRNCMEVGGVWIDEGFTAKTDAVVVKALSDAYFRILERHPGMKSVFKLGNHLVWMAPNGKALVIDTSKGNEKMTDTEIDRLFTK
jgi:Ca-activated chloride channel homolog